MRLVLPTILVLAVLMGLGPHVLDSLPGCGFKRWTGLHCPACGSSRALGHLARGEIGAAVGMNPLFVLGIPALAVVWVWHARRMRRAGRSWGEIPGRAIYFVLAVIAAFWILRNVPFSPFTWMAP